MTHYERRLKNQMMIQRALHLQIIVIYFQFELIENRRYTYLIDFAVFYFSTSHRVTTSQAFILIRRNTVLSHVIKRSAEIRRARNTVD